MKIYKTRSNIYLNDKDSFFELDETWDNLINKDNLYHYLQEQTERKTAVSVPFLSNELIAPIDTQEIWAAGVTYLKSRDARMEESQSSGGSDLYDRVYEAERPELFFKSIGPKAVGPNEKIAIRRDSTWNVPEPELTLVINRSGKIQGYTIGNDVSSRSIEGENALYLPQAKVYDQSAAIGPCIFIPENSFNLNNSIHLIIRRNGEIQYQDSTPVSRMKRSLEELANFLYRENSFHTGCYLMTGTCLVPPSTFTLQPEDEVEISIDEIGQLVNVVSYNTKMVY